MDLPTSLTEKNGQEQFGAHLMSERIKLSKCYTPRGVYRKSILRVLAWIFLTVAVPTFSVEVKTDLSGSAEHSSMVNIPGGDFQMGGEGDFPIRKVKVPAFKMSETEVTVAQFQQFARATQYVSAAERGVGGLSGCQVFDGEKSVYYMEVNWRNLEVTQASDHPVVCLSGEDIDAYIGWLNAVTHKNFRLPSEAEWEYAARAGSRSRFSFGDDEQALCLHGNVADQTERPSRGGRWHNSLSCSDAYAYTAPVKTYLPNNFGLYDMHGNVWELTQDCWHSNYLQAPSDGSARVEKGCVRRVFRGGAWLNPAVFLESAARGWQLETARDFSSGFRLAHDS